MHSLQSHYYTWVFYWDSCGWKGIPKKRHVVYISHHESSQLNIYIEEDNEFNERWEIDKVNIFSGLFQIYSYWIIVSS